MTLIGAVMGLVGRGNNFNLLRLVFAMMVIFAHAPELIHGDRRAELMTMVFGTISFGELAVDSFFVLSGYLIYKSWCLRPKFLVFIINRVLRIFPGFIMSAVICALVIGPIYGADDYFSRFNWRAFLQGLMRLGFSGSPGAFIGTHYPALNGPLWTISWEFKCYLLVAVCGALGLLRRGWLWPMMFIACAAVYFSAAVGWLSFSSDYYYRLGMAFSAGASFYVLRGVIRWDGRLAIMALLVLVALLFFKAVAEIAVCVLWGYAIIFYALHAKVFDAFNELPDVSYGVYLYAWPLNKIVLWHFPDIGVGLSVAVVVALACCAGALSWHLVEKPFLKLKVK